MNDIIHHCVECKTPLTGRRKKFCSRNCKAKHLAGYTSQRKRAVKRKIHFVNLLGGKCSSCGYKQNLSSLVFHHKDPNDKDFDITIRELHGKSITTLEKEISKCVLLCHNCHMEIHYPQFDSWWVAGDLNPEPSV